MNGQCVILVQVAERGWTIAALHAACQMAKRQNGSVLLVKMVPVQHIAWLGTELGYMDFTSDEEDEIDEYQELIEEYSVDYSVTIFQYTSMVKAIVAVVEMAHAEVAFATLPASFVPGWRRLQSFVLRQFLECRTCQFIETPEFDYDDYSASERIPAEEQSEEQFEGQLDDQLMREMPLIFKPVQLEERV